MKIFAYGVSQLISQALKDQGYTVVHLKQLPTGEQVQDQVLICTSETIPLHELAMLRQRFPFSILCYHHLERNLRGFRQVHLLCETHQIHFLSGMATSNTLIDKLKWILDGESIAERRIIGLFGSGPGVGVTSIAASFSKIAHAKGVRVIMLGLNLFDPGWTSGTPPVSLDQWRPKLTGKILQERDFDALIRKEGFSYLPGNQDYLAALDFQENEIEYLLQEAERHADLVVADYGSIPQSAAWYVGMQQSGLRYLVTSSQQQRTRTKELMSLTSHLDVHPTDFSLIVNDRDREGIGSSRILQQEFGIPQGMDMPVGDSTEGNLALTFGKKDQQHLDQHVNALLSTFGWGETAKKKGWFG